MILTPEQAYAIVCNLREPERTLTLLAAGTGLRISECLGLQWHDVTFADGMIHVRRTWTWGQVGLPKSKASKGPGATPSVARRLHAPLETQDDVFPSR